MKTLLLTIVTLMTLSCGQIGHVEADNHGVRVVRNTKIDSDLIPHMNEYKQELRKRGFSSENFDLLKEFVFTKDVGFGHWGLCIIRSDEYGKYTQIFIAPEIRGDFYLVRAVTFHEMGHCIQGAEHSDDINNLMYYQMNIPRGDLIYGWEELKDGLFKEFKRQSLNITGENDEKDFSCVLDQTRG